MHPTSTLKAGVAVLAVVIGLPSTAALAAPCDAKRRVMLLEADDKGVVELHSPPGRRDVALTFHVHTAAREKVGPTGPRALQFWASALVPPDGTPGAAVLPALTREDAEPPSTPSAVVSLTEDDVARLPDAILRLRLSFDVPPDARYAGRLQLLGENGSEWSLHLKTDGFGAIGLDPIEPIRLTRIPGIAVWSTPAATASHAGLLSGLLDLFPRLSMRADGGKTPIAIRDLTGQGPYSDLTLSLDQTAQANYSSRNFLGSNHLKLLVGHDCEQPSSLYDAGTALGSLGRWDVKKACISAEDLGPGEYLASLRVGATNARADDEHSRKAVIVQVRHHWVVAVMIILLGSMVGWMLGRWAPSAWQRRNTGRLIEDRKQSIEALESPIGQSHANLATGAHTPLVAAAWGPLLRADILSRFGAGPTSSGVDGEIEAALKDADARIGQLRKFSEVRSALQLLADSWASLRAEIFDAFNDILLGASSVVCAVASSASQADTAFRATSDRVLGEWAQSQLPAKVIAGAHGLAAEAQHEHGRSLLAERIRGRSWTILEELDALKLNGNPPRLTDLRPIDEHVDRLIALRRGRGQSWGEELAELDQRDVPVDSLYQKGDEEQWESWQNLRASTRASNTKPQAVAPVTLDVVGQQLGALRTHPARILWRVGPKWGYDTKLITEGSRLVYAFPSASTYKVGAALEWAGRSIEIGSMTIDVSSNVDSRRLNTARLVSFTALLLSAGFAAIAGFIPQYDATFGTVQQYLALLLTAAAASGGSNVLLRANSGEKATG